VSGLLRLAGEVRPKVDVPPPEAQRFILAVVLIAGFFLVFGLVFLATRDVEVAKAMLTVLAGALSAIVGFYFGAKSAEEARRGG
jgi:uncharacterized membrane protein